MLFLERLHQFAQSGKCSDQIIKILTDFYDDYTKAILSTQHQIADYEPILVQFLTLVIEQMESPFKFGIFHQKITTPFNYARFGLDFFRPLIKLEESKAYHLSHVDTMVNQLAKGDNVVLFANHQTEPDPQAITLLLEKTHADFADKIIFVAGQRVIADPLAAVFTKGCNILSVFSKKRMKRVSRQRQEQLQHNQRAMKQIIQLLSVGGKCIYVAPGGGRDRADDKGIVAVSPFDPKSIEMFWLISRRASSPTHFYPLALSTHRILPPPNSLEEVEELRIIEAAPIYLSFGQEIDMKNVPESQAFIHNRNDKRNARALYIWELVNQEYQMISNLSNRH